MTQSVLTIFMSGIISAITIAVGYVLTRKKTKAETESIISQQHNDLIIALSKDRNELREEIKENKEHIKRQQFDNEQCEHKHDVVELELQHLKKQIDYKDYHKETVFVVDDNEITAELFRGFLGRISVINCKVFLDHKAFLTEVKKEKPGVVILDHFLDKELTANDIIIMLGYTPEVFIMSSTKEVHLIYAKTAYKFFYKGENYVQKISKAVLEHLKNKN